MIDIAYKRFQLDMTWKQDHQNLQGNPQALSCNEP